MTNPFKKKKVEKMIKSSTTIKNFNYKKGTMVLNWSVDANIEQDVLDSISCFQEAINDLEGLLPEAELTDKDVSPNA